MMMFTRNHTVDKAIAPLLKAQRDLEAVDTERSVLIDKNEAKIVGLRADNVTAKVERTRANRIAAALKAITDPEDLPEVAPATKVEE
jgi:hypothetical protein